MRSGLRDTILFNAYLLAGLLAATAAAWITLGDIAFRQPEFLLRYLAVGFSGALIYVSVRTRGLLPALIMILVLLAGNILLSNSWARPALVEAGLWAVLVGGAYLGAAYLFRAWRRLFMGKFLLMALFVALAYSVGAVVIMTMKGLPFISGIVLSQALAGFRLGAFSGFLFELVDFVGSKLDGRESRVNDESLPSDTSG